jgi:hypothetical protein
LQAAGTLDQLQSAGFDAQDEEIVDLFENGTIFPPKPMK